MISSVPLNIVTLLKAASLKPNKLECVILNIGTVNYNNT